MKGVKFGDIHSWNDLGLILEPFVVPPAIPKTNLLDIPAGDGSLDLTEALGVIRYHDRELVFNFTVNPLSKMTFDEKITQVSNALNGRAFNIILDRDPDWYWEGRCIVNEHLQNKIIGRIVVKAIVRPYKLRHEITTHKLDVYTASSTGKYTAIVVNNGRKPVVPEIEVGDIPIKFEFEGKTYFVYEHYTKAFPDLQLKEGENEITIYDYPGVGDYTTYMNLKFREGAL